MWAVRSDPKWSDDIPPICGDYGRPNSLGLTEGVLTRFKQVDGEGEVDEGDKHEVELIDGHISIDLLPCRGLISA